MNDPGSVKASYATAVVATNTYTWRVNRNVRILSAYIDYTADATAGNRVPRIRVVAPDGTIFNDLTAGTSQAASQNRTYTWLAGVARSSAFDNISHKIACPNDFIVPAGWALKFEDAANISASDSFNLRILYEE